MAYVIRYIPVKERVNTQQRASRQLTLQYKLDTTFIVKFGCATNNSCS